MPKNPKPNRRKGFASAYRYHETYLIRSFGTPDGLRALGEFVRNAAVGLSVFLTTTFILFDKHSLAGKMLRVTVALALSRALASLWQNR